VATAYLSLVLTLAALSSQGVDLQSIKPYAERGFQPYSLVGDCRPVTQRELVRNGDRGVNQVALSFDDGPSLQTSRLLGILAANGVKGTFFVVGINVYKYPDRVRDMLRAGHVIANHTYAHGRPDGSHKVIGEDLDKASQALKETVGLRPCLFRPPYGIVNDRLLKAVSERGMRSIGWDVDPQDWRSASTDFIVDNIVQNTKPGSIILLHEDEVTIAALPKIIKQLKQRGYQFVTADKLL